MKEKKSFFYAPPSSLMDSTVSPKVKITEREGVEARSMARSILGVEGCVRTSRWDLEERQAVQLFT
jgi:hypothetical protein